MEPPQDVRLACLVELEAASAQLHRQISQFTSRWAGTPGTEEVAYRRILSVRRRLEMVEQVSRALNVLNEHGQLYRRAEARALYAEGLTMAELASVFQVSRQRIATLLHEPVEASTLAVRAPHAN